MKFEVERDLLVDAVNWVSRSLSNRPISTALLGIIIEADKSLHFSASDLESSTKTEIPGSVQQPGKVLVPGRLLAEISRSLPNKPISFTLDGTRVNVVSGKSKFTLPILPINEYPNLPNMPTTTGEINSGVFANAINQVAVAAGKDDSLPTLTGVYIEINENQITLAATDRYRLAVKKLDWKAKNPNFKTHTLLRARTLSEAAKFLELNQQLNISLADENSNEKLIGFTLPKKSLISRVLDGSFPPFQHLLPNSFSSEATVEISVFLDAVRRVALVTDKTVPLRLNFTNNSIQLEAGTGDEAQASESIDINYKGEAINIAFNPTYLTDGLNALGTKFAHIGFTGANKPAILTGLDKPDAINSDTYKYLLMPMRYSA
jgi:DNA polymerase-3 subunit beta